MTPLMVTDDEIRHAFAVLALFGGESSDRALAGWEPGASWLDEELRVVERFTGTSAATGEGAAFSG